MEIEISKHTDDLSIEKLERIVGIVLSGTPSLGEQYNIDFKGSSSKIIIRIGKLTDFVNMTDFIVHILSMSYVNNKRFDLPKTFTNSKYRIIEMNPESLQITIPKLFEAFSSHLGYSRDMNYIDNIINFDLNVGHVEKSFKNIESSFIQVWSQHKEYYLSIFMFPLD